MEVPALEDGFIAAIDGQALGEPWFSLAAAACATATGVNPAVGLSDLAGIGEETGAGVPSPLSTP